MKITSSKLSKKFFYIIFYILFSLYSPFNLYSTEIDEEMIIEKAIKNYSCIPEQTKLGAGLNFCLGFVGTVFKDKLNEIDKYTYAVNLYNKYSKEKFIGPIIKGIDSICNSKGNYISVDTGIYRSQMLIRQNQDDAIVKIMERCSKIIPNVRNYVDTINVEQLVSEIRSDKPLLIENIHPNSKIEKIEFNSNKKLVARIYCKSHQAEEITEFEDCFRRENTIFNLKSGKTNLSYNPAEKDVYYVTQFNEFKDIYEKLNIYNGKSFLIDFEKDFHARLEGGLKGGNDGNMTIEIIDFESAKVLIRETLNEGFWQVFTYNEIISKLVTADLKICKHKEVNMCNPDYLKNITLDQLKIDVDTGKTNFSVVNNRGWTSLLYALYYIKDERILDYIIEKTNLINVFNQEGLSPLHLAAENQSFVIFNKLLIKGAEIDYKYKGKSVLHSAAMGKSKELIAFLIEKKFNPNEKDDFNNTSLTNAILNSTSDILNFLISNGANLSEALKDDLIFLHASMGSLNRDPSEEIEILKTLINLGFDPKIKNESNSNALHVVTKNNFQDPGPIIKFLLSIGIPIEETTTWKRTPLHTSASSRNILAIKELLNQGADPNLIDKDQNTPLHLSVRQDEEDVSELVDLLLDKGAMAGAINKDNWSPYGYALVNEVISNDDVRMKLLMGASKTRNSQIFRGKFICQDDMWVGNKWVRMGDEGGIHAVNRQILVEQFSQMKNNDSNFICQDKDWRIKGSNLKGVFSDYKSFYGIFEIKDQPGLYVYVDNMFKNEP